MFVISKLFQAILRNPGEVWKYLRKTKREGLQAKKNGKGVPLPQRIRDIAVKPTVR